MSVPHQDRRSPIVLVLAALGTAGLAFLLPDPDEPPAIRHSAEAAADLEPLGDSPELREELHTAGRTIEMLSKMRGALDSAGRRPATGEPIR